MIPIQGVSANKLFQTLDYLGSILLPILHFNVKSYLCHCLQKCNNPQRICCTVSVHCGVCGVCNTKKLYKQHLTPTTAA